MNETCSVANCLSVLGERKTQWNLVVVWQRLLVTTQYTHDHNETGTGVIPFGIIQRFSNLFYADAVLKNVLFSINSWYNEKEEKSFGV